jgi:hypothetical protein
MGANARDVGFFSRLYSGFQAEYLVAGKLFGAGLEAFKLPADFGFDLLVTNQKETSIGPAHAVQRAHSFPYAVQVKSRRVVEDMYTPGPNSRIEVVVNFRLSNSELDLMSSEDRSYLVCIAFLPAKPEVLGEPALYFWLKGSQLTALHQHSYLREIVHADTAQYDLKVGFRFLPRQTKRALLERLRSAGHVTPEGENELDAILPEELGVSWNAKEYVVLYRCAWTKPEGYYGHRNVARLLRPPHLDLSKIGTAVEFPTEDTCPSFPAISRLPNSGGKGAPD